MGKILFQIVGSITIYHALSYLIVSAPPYNYQLVYSLLVIIERHDAFLRYNMELFLAIIFIFLTF